MRRPSGAETMNTLEYLDAAMKATKSTTDYQLAKALGINRGRISDYRKLKIRPDEYACTRLAVALGLDPVIVLGEIALEWEKRPERREWWQGFLSHAGKLSVIVTLVLLFSTTSPNVHAHGISNASDVSHNIPLCALRDGQEANKGLTTGGIDRASSSRLSGQVEHAAYAFRRHHGHQHHRAGAQAPSPTGWQIAADLGAAAKRQTAHPRCAGQRKRATDRAHPCRCGRCRQGARRSGAAPGRAPCPAPSHTRAAGTGDARL